MTMMAAPDEERQESSMMEDLPVDVLTHILKFMTIEKRVKLAGTNKTLYKRVYRECPQAWEKIDFYQDRLSCRERLSDYDLSGLLERVNGKEVTKYLDLLDCSEVRGSGLACLRHSKTLESIHVAGTGAGENPTPFLSTLRTMIPFNLFSVIFAVETMVNPSESVAEFFHSLRQVTYERALQNLKLCNCCNLPIAERSQQLVPSCFGVPMFHCMECEKSFCKRRSCPMGLRECHDCALSGCDSCFTVSQCYNCGHNYCADCRLVYSCNNCPKTYCASCGPEEDRRQTFKCYNQNCRTIVCKSCAKSPDACSNGCLLCQK